ncbi:MAG TPA: threonine synthase [Chitinophagaceae bacterium]|nr:threonine synthase [Chitinophagaceae bacterium]
MKKQQNPNSLATVLRCSNCNRSYPVSEVINVSPCCNQPLLVEYDLSKTFSKEEINGREYSLWRYFEVLPVKDPTNIISLGEGFTPILPLKKLSGKYGYLSILMKDESHNPTGSFKARGISVAISKAKELGIDKFIIPTAGNAGGALAAYCAKAGMECIVIMPSHTPDVFKNECEMYGARLITVKGLINDCAKKANEINEKNDYFNISTLKEPYRLEGKKTMGYEIAEQLNWELPDVIVYPAGGGTGLIGIWKAFDEMRQLGWIKKPLPKMIAVQPENCTPIKAAMIDPVNWEKNFLPKSTIAHGLAVPFPFGMNLIKKTIIESNGELITVTEKEITDGINEIARTEGIFVSPEGSAVWKALDHLKQKGSIKDKDNILLLNTGSGYKYMEDIRNT